MKRRRRFRGCEFVQFGALETPSVRLDDDGGGFRRPFRSWIASSPDGQPNGLALLECQGDERLCGLQSSSQGKWESRHVFVAAATSSLNRGHREALRASLRESARRSVALGSKGPDACALPCDAEGSFHCGTCDDEAERSKCGMVENPPGSVIRLRCHNCGGNVLAGEGHATVESDGETFSASAGNATSSPRGLPHRVINRPMAVDQRMPLTCALIEAERAVVAAGEAGPAPAGCETG